MPADSSTDAALLKTFARTGAQDAFRALVDRYAGLVFSAALRRAGQRPLAEEITQNVFAVLARKAASLAGPDTRLAAWLHRATLLECASALRRETARRRRLDDYTRYAQVMAEEPPADSSDILSELDLALDALPRRDRELLFARFFEGRGYQEIAKRTGHSEAALMQRQHRALTKLESLMKRRGASVSIATLTTALSAGLAQPAPAGLTAALAASAPVSAAGIGAGALFFHTLEILMHTKAKLTFLTAFGLCLLGGAGAYQTAKARTEARMRPQLDAALAATAEAKSGAGNPRSSLARFQPAPAPAPATLQEKLEAAAAGWRAADDFPDRMKALEALDSLTSEESVAAREFLETVKEDSGLHRALAKRIAMLWSAHEPESALEWAMTALERDDRLDPLKGILNAWAHREPQKALAWWRKVRDSLQFPVAENAFENLEKVIYAGWASADARGLALSLPEVKDIDEIGGDNGDGLDAAFLGLASAAVSPETRRNVFDAVRAIPHDKTKAAASVMISMMLSTGGDAAQAREFALSLNIADPAARADALGAASLMEVMLNPSAAKESVVWLRNQVGREAASRVVEEFIKEADPDNATIATLRQVLEAE